MNGEIVELPTRILRLVYEENKAAKRTRVAAARISVCLTSC